MDTPIAWQMGSANMAEWFSYFLGGEMYEIWSNKKRAL